ncbi:sulfite exporter TauE/SafE family protein [Flavobacteriales bacterium]|nr:sulfite exporter TauE/SafE family protein [Flavobacteriales bacterium]
MNLFGVFGALLIGIVLGLIGGGGSILTVPIFVYVLDLEPVLATAYSLFVVGIAALFGAIKNAQENLVEYKTGFVFAIPAFIGVYIARRFLLDLIPNIIFKLGEFSVTKDMGIMMFFALIMILASFFMIKDQKEQNINKKFSNNINILIIEGFIVGILTGIVGAGGGFIIIPALVLFAGLPMKNAIGTSLMIIAIKSLFGFIGDLQNSNIIIDWLLLGGFTFLSIVGIFAGLYFNKFIEGNKLKKGFGWFVLIMGVSIVLKEII